MDEALVAFVSLRVAEDELRAEHLAMEWVDGRADWVDEGARVVGDVRRGLLEVADTLRRNGDSTVAAMGEDILRLLASLYADHADYRAEWRPRMIH